MKCGIREIGIHTFEMSDRMAADNPFRPGRLIILQPEPWPRDSSTSSTPQAGLPALWRSFPELWQALTLLSAAGSTTNTAEGYQVSGNVVLADQSGDRFRIARDTGPLRRVGVFTSASTRCLDGGDVDLLHRHHHLEGTLGLTATSRKRIG